MLPKAAGAGGAGSLPASVEQCREEAAIASEAITPQCPACVLGMGIPGGQGGCKLLSPQVTWLSLGLQLTRKDEVHGQSQLGHPEKAEEADPRAPRGWCQQQGGTRAAGGGVLAASPPSWLVFTVTTLFSPSRVSLRWEERLILSLCCVWLPAGETCGGSCINPTLLRSPLPLQAP